MDLTKYVVEYREAAFLLGDHAAYRAQLTRRLRTVQKKLGRATPKNAKYATKTPVTAADIARNIEFLHVVLLTAERAWAHAMAMKALHSEDKADQNITGSTRRHIVSRLHKAVVAAKDVVALLSDPASGASETDVLEAQAYVHALAGALEFEKQAEGIKPQGVSPQRWDACLAHLAAARVLYSALHTATGDDLFKDLLAATIDPSIRYAAYQNRIPRTVGVPAVAAKYFPKDDQLARAVQKLDPTALHDDDDDAATASSASSHMIWRGRSANIVDAAIGHALLAVHAASTALAQSTSTSTSSSTSSSPSPSPKDRANAYDAVLIASQDAVDATRRAIDELDKEGVDEADPRMQDLRVTALAVNYDLIAWRIGRNRVLIGPDDGLTFASNPPQKQRRPRKDGKHGPDRDEPTGRKLARLRERTALYDAILQSIDSIKALPGAARDTAFIAELDAQRAYFHALKCLNLSHAHAFLAAPKHALALCSRALTLAHAAASPSSSTDTPTSTASIDTPIKLALSPSAPTALHTTLTHMTSHYRGLVALSQLSAPSPAKQTSTPTAPVVTRLNEYPTTGTLDLHNLVTWPPKLQPVPVKPLFLDVAWNYVQYPGQQREVVEGSRAEDKEEVDVEMESSGQQAQGVVEERPKVKKGWFSFGR